VNREPTPSLYVTGLPEYADAAAVTERFKIFGPVKDVDFPVADKPFCFVHFESQAGVDKAMATEDDFIWDEYEVYYEPKRARPPLPQGGSSSGSATGKGQPTTSNYKPVTKNNETKTQSNKGQQPTNNQEQNQQEPSEEGTWKKVEYRSTRRKEEKAEKKRRQSWE